MPRQYKKGINVFFTSANKSVHQQNYVQVWWNFLKLCWGSISKLEIRNKLEIDKLTAYHISSQMVKNSSKGWLVHPGLLTPVGTL